MFDRMIIRLLPALVLVFLIAGGGSAVASQQSSSGDSLKDIFGSYNFQEHYFDRDADETVMSAWGRDNPGRLRWTYLQNQYNPEKTGAALLKEPAYAKLEQRLLLEANADLPEEEQNAFREAAARLLPEAAFEEPETEEAVSEAAKEAVTEAAEADRTEDGGLYGMDTLFGLAYIDRVMMDENDPSDEEAYFTVCRYAKKALYYAMLHVYAEDTMQRAYLSSQLDTLSGMDVLNAEEAVSYDDYIRQQGEEDATEQGKWSGVLQPFG